MKPFLTKILVACVNAYRIAVSLSNWISRNRFLTFRNKKKSQVFGSAEITALWCYSFEWIYIRLVKEHLKYKCVILMWINSLSKVSPIFSRWTDSIRIIFTHFFLLINLSIFYLSILASCYIKTDVAFTHLHFIFL